MIPHPLLASAALLLGALCVPAPQTSGHGSSPLPAALPGTHAHPSDPRVSRVSRSYVRPAVTGKSMPSPRLPAQSTPRRPRPGGLHNWRASAKARAVIACESHGNYTDMSHHGGTIYYGAWQANAAFWLTYGGPARYLADRSRFTAPAALQDAVAYRGWLARGWSPWACA